MTEPFDEMAELEGELVEEEAGRHATNLELFFDLVFVFAVSQLSRLIASDISAAGVAKSALVAWIVWQLWSQFSWLGTSIDLDRDARTRLAFISSIFPTLFLAISIPDAYGDTGGRFGLAVLAGTAWVLGLQGMGLWSDPHTRKPFIRYASLAGITPILIAVGGFLDETPRVVTWVVGAAIGIAGTFAVNRQSASDDEDTSWRVDPVHFAERHGLFVIIVLGEVLVAIGVAARDHDMTLLLSGAILASAFLATVLWWAYFGFISRFGEEGLCLGHGVERARLARDFFTLGHFPLVLGIAFLASVIEHVVAHPEGHLHGDQLWLLGTAVVLVGGGFVGLQWRLRRHVNIERPVAIGAVILLLATVGPHVGGVATIALVAAVMTAMQAVTTVRVSRDHRPDALGTGEA
jgi:low temperature requirement protein LtrA